MLQPGAVGLCIELANGQPLCRPKDRPGAYIGADGRAFWPCCALPRRVVAVHAPHQRGVPLRR